MTLHDTLERIDKITKAVNPSDDFMCETTQRYLELVEPDLILKLTSALRLACEALERVRAGFGPTDERTTATWGRQNMMSAACDALKELNSLFPSPGDAGKEK